MAELRLMMWLCQSFLAPRLFRAVRAALAQCVIDALQQFVAVERFGEVAEQSFAGGLHRVGNRPVSGEHDHRQGRHLLLQRIEQRQTVHALHTQIGDHDMRLPGADPAQRLLATGSGLHLKTVGFKAQRQQFQQPGVIICQQDPVMSRWEYGRLKG